MKINTYAKFNVNFNKKNAYTYFESKNIFPFSAKKIGFVIFTPVLINNKENELIYFRDQTQFTIIGKINKKNYHLLNYILAERKISRDTQIFNNNKELIEEYNFDKIVQKVWFRRLYNTNYLPKPKSN